MGFFLQHLQGEGLAWLELSGEMFEYDLPPGETLRVHPSHVGAFAEGVQFSVTTVPGLSNKMFGGNGFFLATLTGPGKVWLQSMSITQLAVEIADHLPSGSTAARARTGASSAACSTAERDGRLPAALPLLREPDRGRPLPELRPGPCAGSAFGDELDPRRRPRRSCGIGPLRRRDGSTRALHALPVVGAACSLEPPPCLAASLGAGLLGLLCLGLVIGLVASLWARGRHQQPARQVLLLVLAGIQLLALAVLGTGLGILWRHRGDYVAQRQSAGD